jgi:hypothetical protein
MELIFLWMFMLALQELEMLERYLKVILLLAAQARVVGIH